MIWRGFLQPARRLWYLQECSSFARGCKHWLNRNAYKKMLWKRVWFKMRSGVDLSERRNVPLPSALEMVSWVLHEGGRNKELAQGAGKEILIFVLFLKVAFNISKSKRHFERNTTLQNITLKRGSFWIKINFEEEKCEHTSIKRETPAAPHRAGMKGRNNSQIILLINHQSVLMSWWETPHPGLPTKGK